MLLLALAAYLFKRCDLFCHLCNFLAVFFAFVTFFFFHANHNKVCDIKFLTQLMLMGHDFSAQLCIVPRESFPSAWGAVRQPVPGLTWLQTVWAAKGKDGALPCFRKCRWHRSYSCSGSAFHLVPRSWSVLAKLSSSWRSWDVLAAS